MKFAQKLFSGNRCSDHMTVLNAFYQWESLFCRNIDTTEFCDSNMLSLPSLTTIADVRVKFIKIYLNSFFKLNFNLCICYLATT